MPIGGRLTVVGAGKLFVVELAAEMSDRVGKTITAQPKVDGSIFRICRDTRFSKDKTPYKTNQAFYVWQSEKKPRKQPPTTVSIEPSTSAMLP